MDGTTIWKQRAGITDDYILQNPDSFDGEVMFGTAGLRGIDGLGTNRINRYVIARAAQGLSIMIKRGGGSSVGISFDGRLNSAEYARLSAEVFIKNGLSVYITEHIMPTPYLAYCLKELRLSAGVMVTASHNPREYSGYKVYGSDACQIGGAYAVEVWDIIKKLDYFDIARGDFDKGVKSGAIKHFPARLLQGYLDQIRRRGPVSLSGIKVCYTALNGAGAEFVPKLLSEAGAQVLSVKEQSLIDPDFTTCPYPNPEKAEAFELAKKYAAESGCDIILATDPDADRIGAMYRDAEGNYTLLSGDEIGLLITHRVLSRQSRIQEGSIIARSVVTMPLSDAVAKSFGVSTVETYTGFKNICAPAQRFIKEGAPEKFVLGYEESNGICVGTYALDKDGIMAAVLLADIAAQAKRAGATVAGVLKDIYKEYGYMTSRLMTFRTEGSAGRRKIDAVMARLREAATEICGYKLLTKRDFLQPQPGFESRENVLVLQLEQGIRLCMRPSGTEPVLKVYMHCCDRQMRPFKKLSEFISDLVSQNK